MAAERLATTLRLASTRCTWTRGHPLQRPRAAQTPATATMREIAACLRHDGFDHYRAALFEEVRARFGPLAAEHLKARLGRAPGPTVAVWERRAGYRVSYPELLEPAALAVELITPAVLLKHVFGAAIQKSSVLLRFTRCRDGHADRLHLQEHAPWLADLPRPGQAMSFLRLRGWLLLACEDSDQAPLLVQATMESSRLSVSLIVPARIAGESAADVELRYLRSVQEGLAACLRAK